MINMIIADLSGRRRQSPIALGGEDQSLSTKDTLSTGPVDTHWSHVYINSVRYISQTKYQDFLEKSTFQHKKHNQIHFM